MTKFKNLFITSILTLTTLLTTAQTIQQYRQQHSKLLAKQEYIHQKIRVEEADRYARFLYEGDNEVFASHWDNHEFNPYKGVTTPNSKTFNVSQYCMPVKHNSINSHFGYRKQFGRMHYGVDLRAQVGDTIYATFTGKVRITKFERAGYGFYVVIRHDNGLETLYGHLSRFLVKPNQYVKAGEPIALSGNTGRSTGPHLHFETRYMGHAINPEHIFDFVNRTTHQDSFSWNKTEHSNTNPIKVASTPRKRKKH